MPSDLPAVGRMRQVVSIQERTISQDSYGSAVPSWSTVGTRFGNLEPISGREMWQARQVRADTSHVVTMRYYEGLTPTHRLVIDGATFQITSVVNRDGRKRFHWLECIEEVTNA